MKKILMLALAFVFLASQLAIAAPKEMTDNELDGVSAGDWVLLDTNGDAVPDELEEVWYNTNDIKLQDESQMEIQAVNNVNTVDSAAVVQNSILYSVAGEGAASGANWADVTNYNPRESTKDTLSTDNSTHFELSKFQLKKKEFSSEKSYSSDFGLTKNNVLGIEARESETTGAGFAMKKGDHKLITETLDINKGFAAHGETETEDGNNGETESEFTAVGLFLLDYDYDEDSGSSSSKSGSFSKTEDEYFRLDKTEDLDIAKSEDAKSSKSFKGLEICSFSITKDLTNTSDETHETQRSLSENNHIDLEDTSQTNLKVVTNLNTVGSGVAVQNNIASSIQGVGSYTHSNTATVVNGM